MPSGLGASSPNPSRVTSASSRPKLSSKSPRSCATSIVRPHGRRGWFMHKHERPRLAGGGGAVEGLCHDYSTAPPEHVEVDRPRPRNLLDFLARLDDVLNRLSDTLDR